MRNRANFDTADPQDEVQSNAVYAMGTVTAWQQYPQLEVEL